MNLARNLRLVAAALLFLVLAGAQLLPVYSDEIGWRFQERAGFDGVDKMFSEVCGPNTLAAPVFFMWPVRWFSAAMNGTFAEPVWVRASGVLYALALVGLVLLIVRRLASERAERSALGAIALGLLGLGVTPFLIVLSRPEQPILLMTCLALLVGLSGSEGETPRKSAWLRSLAVVPLALIALSYHPKGVFVIPLMLLCIALASRGRANLPAKAVAAVLVTGATVLAAGYWKGRLGCPADPLLAWFYDMHSLNARIAAVHDLPSALSAAGALVANLPVHKYIAIAAPAPDPMAGWLPPGRVSGAQEHAWFVGIVLVWALAQVLAVVAIVAGLASAWRARTIDRRLLLAIGLVVTTLGWGSTVLSRNPYEAAFVLPLLVLSVIFALSLSPLAMIGRWREKLATLAVAGAVASLLLLAIAFAPALVAARQQPGYLKDQPHSVSLAGFDGMRVHVLAAARLCGIADPARARALMVDDLTYFPLMHSRLPQHQLGVIGLWKGGLRDPVGYLRSRGSDGAVCCLGPPGW